MVMRHALRLEPSLNGRTLDGYRIDICVVRPVHAIKAMQSPFTLNYSLIFHFAALCFLVGQSVAADEVEAGRKNVSFVSAHCSPQPGTGRPPAKTARKLLPSELVRALREGDLAQLKARVTSRNHLLLRDTRNNTLAHWAARVGNVEMLRFLIGKKKTFIESRGEYSVTPLIAATAAGKTNAVKFLLDESGADPNARTEESPANGANGGLDALLVAAMRGYLDIVKLLLEHGANATTADPQARTPLIWAADHGRLDIVQYLMEWCNRNHNCSKHDSLFSRARNGNTPIHEAAIIGRTDIVRYLVRLDRRLLAARGPYNATVLHLAARLNDVATLRETLGYAPDLEALANYSLDPNGALPSVTALMLAAGQGHAQSVRMLLQAGANDSATDRTGNAAIHKAATGGYSAVVEALLDKNPNSVNAIGARSATPLHVAVSSQRYELVRLLLRRGANISVSASYKDVFNAYVSLTPLLLAATTGNVPILRALLESGAHVDRPDGLGGAFPIHLAAQNGHIAVAEELLARDKCQLEWRTGRYMETPLNIAIRARERDMGRWLLRLGANTEAKSRYPKDGEINEPSATPLILATRQGNAKMVEALLGHGADPNVADEYGSTPLHYAAALNISRPTELLIRHGAKGGVENMHGETPLEVVFGNYHRTRDQLTLIVVNDPLPLHRAVEKDSLALLTRAIQRLPTRLNQRASQRGETALEMAVRLGKVLTARVMIEVGMRVDTVSAGGNTLLQMAASVANTTIQRQLTKLISHDLGSQAGPLLHIGPPAAREHSNRRYGGPIPYTPPMTPLHTEQPRQRTLLRCPLRKSTTRIPCGGAKRPLPYALQKALHVGDVAKMRALLNETTLLLIDRFNDTLASIAAWRGDVGALRYLISRERQLVNAPGADGYTPLHIAAKRGHTEAVRLLLDAGAKVSAVSKYGADETGRGATAANNRSEVLPTATPLHFAAREGRLGSVRLLLQHGASVTARDWHGRTPLHWAAMMGNLEVVRQLVSHATRANLWDAILLARDEDGDMPIHGIATDDHATSAAILDYLVGVAPRLLVAQGEYNNTVLHKVVAANDAATLRGLLAHRPNLESMAGDPTGTRPSRTPLMAAAAYGYEGIVRMLLDAGANDTAIDRWGNSAVHQAAAAGHSNVVGALLDSNPDSVNLAGNRSYTPLYFAVTNQHYALVQLLLERGANLSARATYRNPAPNSTARPSAATPLLLAATTGNLPILRALLERGARMDQPDSEFGRFPIHSAASHGHIALVEELLARDPCQLEWGDFDAQTPLTAAIEANRTEAAELLIASGANIEAKAHYDNELPGEHPSLSPLMVAVHNANVRLVKSLLLRGADPNAVDVGGRSALHHAIQPHAELLPMASLIIAALIRHGAMVGVENADGLTVTERAFAYNPDGSDFHTLFAADPHPLHRAVERDSAALLRKAVHYLPTRLHQRNSRGETPLEMAVRLGKVPVVEAMLESGLRVDTVDADGNTLLHIAADYRNATIRAQLVEMISVDAGDEVLATLLSRRNKTGVSLTDIALRDAIVEKQLHKVIVRNVSP